MKIWTKKKYNFILPNGTTRKKYYSFHFLITKEIIQTPTGIWNNFLKKF